jgi:gliding motility-associated-like protein
MKRILLLILLLFCHLRSGAQGENNNWCFGDRVGLAFNGGAVPDYFPDSLSSFESCGALSNAAGKLLFYCDGTSVYNRDHRIMPNGSGIRGNHSTQYGVGFAVCQNIPHTYYLFTITELGSASTLSVSTIDTTPDGGLGDVQIKNQLLGDSMSEKMLLAGYGRNQWLITHHQDSGIFYAFSLKDGLNPTPVRSYVGAHRGHRGYSFGELKCSPDFRHLYMTNYKIYNPGTHNLEMYDFDEYTGIVSNHRELDTNKLGFFGVEVSPDGSRLYTTGTEPKGIYQYDLNAGSLSAIKASRFQIQAGYFKGTRMGPDSMIYVMLGGVPQNVLRIRKPNLLGMACSPEPNCLPADYPATHSAENFGINFLSTVESNDTSTEHIRRCLGTECRIGKAGRNNYVWQDGATDSFRIIDHSGTYYLSSRKANVNYTDTFVVSILPYDTIRTHLDTGVCPGELALLSAPEGYQDYLWTGGYTGKDTTISSDAHLQLKASDTIGCRILQKDIQLRFAAFTELPAAATICDADTIRLKVASNDPDAKYQWNNGATTPEIWVSKAGTQKLNATVFGCTLTHSVEISETSINTTIEGKREFCLGDKIRLSAVQLYASYQWSTGEKTASIDVYNPGIYTLMLTKGGCSRRAEVSVSAQDCTHCVAFANAFTPNNDGINDRFGPLIFCSDPRFYELVIANRWGQEMFHSSGFKEKWDGTFDGKACSDGVYFYMLRISFGNGDKQLYKGDLTLLR